MSLNGKLPPEWKSIQVEDFLTGPQIANLLKCTSSKEIQEKVLSPDWGEIEKKIMDKTGQGADIRYMAYALEYAIGQTRPAHRGAYGGAHV